MGYLVPEFPGQTHAFFWRELGELRRLGVEVDIVSTRRPPAGVVSHAWSAGAAEATHYMFPPGVGSGGRCLLGLVKAGPTGVARAAAGVARCEGRLRLAGLTLAAAELMQLARARRWEHLHVHSAADAAHVAMLCRRLGGPRYSITLHGPLEDYGPNQAEKWRHAAFGIVITRRLLGELGAALGESMPAEVTVAPMGVEVAKFARASSYQPWDGVGPAKLFCCARLNRVKGHAELVRAVGVLRSRGLDVRLTIAGQDDRGGTGYRRELEALVAELGLVEFVMLAGAVDEGEVIRGLHGAQVFVLASHHEPLGVAIMEAMAAGTPVVATRGGGVTELVTDGEDGILVEPREVAGLADAIERVLRDGVLARRLAEAGVETVRRSFHSGVSAAAMMRRIVGSAERGVRAGAKAGAM